ncbi:MAG: TlpA disulfide reductase family protein [Desulfobacterales bacterium]|jgi:peroxiredoxin
MSTTEKTRTSRNTGVKTMILIFLLIVGIGIIVLLKAKDDSMSLTGQTRLGKGAKAPDFTLPGLDGKMVRLADQKGKVVFLNIWATWCPPCVDEMPSMEKLHQQLKGEEFKILAVSIDKNGAEAVLPFMKKHNLSFTALIDSKESLKYKYQTTGVPETFIIDRNGVIVEKVIGPRDWAAPDVIGYFRNLVQRN